MRSLVLVTDCGDMAAATMHATVSARAKPSFDVLPIVTVRPAFSVVNANYLTRRIADSLPAGSIISVTVSPGAAVPQCVAGRTAVRELHFVGSNVGGFDWLVRDFGCAELVELDVDVASGGFRGREHKLALAARLAAGERVASLGKPLAPAAIRQIEPVVGMIQHISRTGDEIVFTAPERGFDRAPVFVFSLGEDELHVAAPGRSPRGRDGHLEASGPCCWTIVAASTLIAERWREAAVVGSLLHWWEGSSES